MYGDVGRIRVRGHEWLFSGAIFCGVHLRPMNGAPFGFLSFWSPKCLALDVRTTTSCERCVCVLVGNALFCVRGGLIGGTTWVKCAVTTTQARRNDHVVADLCAPHTYNNNEWNQPPNKTSQITWPDIGKLPSRTQMRRKIRSHRVINRAKVTQKGDRETIGPKTGFVNAATWCLYLSRKKPPQLTNLSSLQLENNEVNQCGIFRWRKKLDREVSINSAILSQFWSLDYIYT